MTKKNFFRKLNKKKYIYINYYIYKIIIIFFYFFLNIINYY